MVRGSCALSTIYFLSGMVFRCLIFLYLVNESFFQSSILENWIVVTFQGDYDPKILEELTVLQVKSNWFVR